MAPWLDFSWALLAVFIVCRCVFTRGKMTSSERIALLLLALLACPIISAADDFAAISRPQDPVFAFDTVAMFVLAFEFVVVLCAFEVVSFDNPCSASPLLINERDSRGPPLAIAA